MNRNQCLQCEKLATGAVSKNPKPPASSLLIALRGSPSSSSPKKVCIAGGGGVIADSKTPSSLSSDLLLQTAAVAAGGAVCSAALSWWFPRLLLALDGPFATNSRSAYSRVTMPSLAAQLDHPLPPCVPPTQLFCSLPHVELGAW